MIFIIMLITIYKLGCFDGGLDARVEAYYISLMEKFLGVSANAISHNINYASEIPTFEEFAEVNSSGCAIDKSRSGGTTLMIAVNL